MYMETLAERLHNLMKNNIVSFTFRKKDGTIRHATGTRNLSLVRAAYGIVVPTPTHAEQPNSYYDLDKEGWRSYVPENVLSIEGYGFLATPTNNGFNPKKPKTIEVEPPKREIPVKFHTADGTDTPIGTAKTLGNPTCEELPIGNGKSVRVKMQPVDLSGLFGGGIPMGEIRKSMDKLDKDIEIVPLGGKVGTPTFTDKGVELEMGIGVDDFAKLVAKYVVAELAERLTK